MTIIINNLEFANQTEAKSLIQALVQTCPSNGVSKDADTVLRVLFEGSDDYRRTNNRPFMFKVIKQGGVPMHVEVHGIFPDSGFRWGWNSTLKQKAHSQRVTQSAREAIRHQRPERCIITTPICPLCDNPFTEDDNTHWDHKGQSFKSIWCSFLDGMDLSEDQIELTKHGDIRDFADASLKAGWQAFHEIYAQWQLTHSSCNMSKGRRDD